MQHAEETTAEAEAKCLRGLWFVMQGCVVELELLQRVAKSIVVVGADGIEAREYARVHSTKARQGLGGPVVFEGKCVPDRGTIHLLDAGDDESNLPGTEHVRFQALGCKYTHFLYLIDASR